MKICGEVPVGRCLNMSDGPKKFVSLSAEGNVNGRLSEHGVAKRVDLFDR